EAKRIRDADHEIGAHGNVHEAVDGMSREQEETIMRAQLAILQDQLGVRPLGYRSPSWDVNVWTPDILKAHGFLYDSSLMGSDVPYEVDTAHGPLIEVPVQWIMDDAPLFRHVYGAGNVIADPARVFDLWSREFAAMHRENGCYVLTCHPFVIGRASRIALVEDLVRFMQRSSGVWFTTGEEIARWHAQRPAAAAAPRRAGGKSAPPDVAGLGPRRPGRATQHRRTG